jgi:hypothetical protein
MLDIALSLLFHADSGETISHRLESAKQAKNLRPATILYVAHQVVKLTECRDAQQRISPSGQEDSSSWLIATRISSQSFDAFLGDDRSHYQRRRRVSPPPAEQGIQEQTAQQDC